jgi:uncharacterized protein
MIDKAFVFDAAVHVMDWSVDRMKDGVAFKDPELVGELIRLNQVLVGGVFEADPGAADLPDDMTGSIQANYDTIFGQAPTDMAVVGSLAFGPGTQSELYEDPNYFLKLNHAFAAAYPERCIFSGGVEPYGRDIGYALESIEYQVDELGARLMKFYPLLWRCDDEKIAYPLYEKCREIGINLLQFHLCLPADSSHDVEIQRPNYLQRAARDFPDLTFIMHHPMQLYFDETVNIAMRFPNIHLIISPMIQMSIFRPRLIQKLMGELLQSVGSDKLMYGSEGAIAGNPTRYIKALLDFEIPEDLQDGYGYPQITREDKEKILGLNIARHLGIDVEAKKQELAALESG